MGDVIIAVDGEEMKGRKLAEVLRPGRPSYAFTVLRRKVTSSKTTLVEEQQAAACKVQATRGVDPCGARILMSCRGSKRRATPVQ